MSEPGKGIHSIRLFDIAIVDVVLTVAAAVVISRWTKWNVWAVLVTLFLLGIAVHRALGIRTKVDRLIF